MKKRILTVTGIVLLQLMLFITPAYAATIDTPDVKNIVQITFYQSCIETNDQLCIVEFALDYTAANPPENANEAWLFRILNAADEEVSESVAPFAYYDDGYSVGIVSFYFATADILTWEGVYKVEMIGNPALDWTAGDPPSVTDDGINWETDSSAITPRIRALAGDFGIAYADIAMREKIGGVWKLSLDYGEPYFTTVIDNLSLIAPDLFQSLSTQPIFREREYAQAGKTAMEGRWVGIAPFDLTDLAALLGISRMWVTSMFWIIIGVGALILVLKKAESREPATFLFGAWMVIGAFTGFLTTEIAIFCGVVGALALVYTFAWKGAA